MLVGVGARDAHLAGTALPDRARATERLGRSMRVELEELALVIKVKIDNYTATEKLLVREGKMNSKISCFVGVAAGN